MNRCFVLSLFLLLAGSFAAQSQDTVPVRIALLREATVDDVVVSLNQIAKITGGTAAMRKRIGTLDISDFKLGASQQVVHSEQIRFRLLLAGIEAAEFRLGGAARTLIVESEQPVTQRMILAAAQEAVRSRYAGDPKQATIRAHGGFALPDLAGASASRVRLRMSVKGPVPASGFARVEVAVSVSGSVRGVVPVDVEIIEPAASKAPASQAVRQAVHWAPAPREQPIVVKTRDTVKLVAYIGAIRIVAGGEAQQDGRIGQMIRVRNLSSNETVIGRIEGDGIVVVEH